MFAKLGLRARRGVARRASALTLSALGVLSAAYGVSTFAEKSANVDNAQPQNVSQKIPKKRATHPELAKKNLNHSLDRARRLSAAQPNSPAAAKGVADLLLMRLQFYRNYDDLDELKTLCDRWANDARAEAQYLCADVDAARHDFVAALKRITQAAKRSGSCADANRRVAAIGATLELETNQALSATPAAGDGPEDTPEVGYTSAVMKAALATAESNPEQAVSYYRQAVSEYTDVSPYPIAWAWHQTAELLRERNPLQAKNYYEAALRYLPDYVAPRVELASLQIEQGDASAALENLQLAAQLSADPDIDNLVAEALAAVNATKTAASEAQIAAARQKAAAGFEALLKRHPYAFADHAAEVFSELDSPRAKELLTLLNNQRQEVTEALAAVGC